MQRLTTKEPTDDMLEVAIISIKCALRDDFPEFREFYDNREWEPKTEAAAGEDESTGGADVDVAPAEPVNSADDSCTDEADEAV